MPLRPLLFAPVDDLHSNQIYACLRAAAATWPAGHEPQAFLLLFARTVGGREIFLADGPPVTMAADIIRATGDASDADLFLVLGAIGNVGTKLGYEPLRVYAQPILDGHHFNPVASAAERRLLAELLQLQWMLDAAGVTAPIKPLFDIATEFGPCRPPLMVDIGRISDGFEQMNIVELADAARLADGEERLGHASIGETVSIEPAALGRVDLRVSLFQAMIGELPNRHRLAA